MMQIRKSILNKKCVNNMKTDANEHLLHEVQVYWQRPTISFRHFGMSAFTKDTKYNLPEMKEKKC